MYVYNIVQQFYTPVTTLVVAVKPLVVHPYDLVAMAWLATSRIALNHAMNFILASKVLA